MLILVKQLLLCSCSEIVHMALTVTVLFIDINSYLNYLN